MSPSYQLTLKATKEASCRLWNNALITSEEKRKAMLYLADNFENLAKIYALNKRMGDLVLTRTSRSQRP